MKTRMHICPVKRCFKSFRDEESLRMHEGSHECVEEQNPKDFTCQKCNRVLATKQSLKEHSFTHSEKKLFRCSEIGCGKTFRQSSQLCNHRKVHKEAKKLMKNQSIKNTSVDHSTEKHSDFIRNPLFLFFSEENSKIILPPIYTENQEINISNINSNKVT